MTVRGGKRPPAHGRHARTAASRASSGRGHCAALAGRSIMRDMIGSTIPEWLEAYRRGATPELLVGELLDRLPVDDAAFISRIRRDDLSRQLARLAARRKAVGDAPGALPLYGVPFAVKDNIDVAGVPTTAACPAFAYVPAPQRRVVAAARRGGRHPRREDQPRPVRDRAGRHPVALWRGPATSFDPATSPAAPARAPRSVVARGLVPFALGTDTAGSGRVPGGPERHRRAQADARRAERNAGSCPPAGPSTACP